MEQNQFKPKSRDFITKEFFILFSPFLAAYLWNIFYEAGYAQVFGLPLALIQLDAIDVLLTNRLTLIAATLAFLWIGLYYNLLPSMTSPLFKGLITLLLILAISLGFFFGRSSAHNKSEYLTTMYQGKDLIVLRVYQDNIITSPFDRTQKTMGKAFHIFKVGARPNLLLTLEKIGPLDLD